jgi:3-isopropylmalate dehydrogenase
MLEPSAALAASCVPGWAVRAVPEPPYVLGVVPGEGVGPEVIGAALTVLEAVTDTYGLAFDVRVADDLGAPGPHGPVLTDTMAAFFGATFAAGAPALCGAVGGRFVYDLRVRFDLYCKLVPFRPSPSLTDASIVRPDRLGDVDVLLVRDNVSGLYVGEYGRRSGGRVAYQHLVYSADEIDRILEVACRASEARHGRLAVVTKRGGIPEVSALWQERSEVVAADRAVTVEIIDVDNACYQVVAHPRRFDVIVASNMLGDVVADAATLLLGSRGMSFSANFGENGAAVYQTGHGAAHDLAGTGRANPTAQILSLAMLLRESFGLFAAGAAVEHAVEAVLAAGVRTADIAAADSRVVGTHELAVAVAENMANIPA